MGRRAISKGVALSILNSMPTEQVDSASILLQFKGTPAEPSKVKLLGIRGYYLGEGEPGINDMGIYDDLLVSCIDGKVTGFRASVDPGSYYLNHPLNPQGCARLRCGLWKYRVGTHREAHLALVQAAEVEVDRVSSTGHTIMKDKGYFGINIHSGGPEKQVGKFSAGCQVVYCPGGAWGSDWLEFFSPIKIALLAFKQEEVSYLLVDKLVATAA